jgi:acetyl esterase
MTTPYVRPDVQMMLSLMASQPAPPISELDPPAAREVFRAMAGMADPPRGDLAEVKDLGIPGPAGPIPARLYRPSASSAPAPVVLFFHGGGWVIGDLETHDSVCAEIARGLGLAVLAIDYRLAPEHPFPAAVEDCLAAADWLATSPADIGHPVTGLIPTGDSAGGNLAAIVSQNRAATLPIPAQWLIYPGTDMTASTGSMEDFAEGYLLTRASMDWFMRHYITRPEDLESPLASPLYTRDLSGQPPTLLFTCGLDPLRDQGRAYAARLVAAGVPTIFREAAGQIHGSLNLRAGIPSAQADLAANLRALQTLLAEANTRAA